MPNVAASEDAGSSNLYLFNILTQLEVSDKDRENKSTASENKLLAVLFQNDPSDQTMLLILPEQLLYKQPDCALRERFWLTPPNTNFSGKVMKFVKIPHKATILRTD